MRLYGLPEDGPCPPLPVKAVTKDYHTTGAVVAFDCQNRKFSDLVVYS